MAYFPFRFMLLLWLALPAALWAQDATASRHLWFNANLEAELSPRWALRTEVHLRRTGGLHRWETLLFRPAVVFSPSHRLSMAAGVSYLSHMRECLDGGFRWMPVYETWQDVVLHERLGRLRLQQRFLLEERWVASPVAVGSDQLLYHFQTHLRLRLNLTLPLTARELHQGVVFAQLSEEVKFSADRHQPAERGFTRNRLMLLMGYQYHPKGSILIGYMWQLHDTRPLTPLDHDHALRIILNHTFGSHSGHYTRPA